MTVGMADRTDSGGRRTRRALPHDESSYRPDPGARAAVFCSAGRAARAPGPGPTEKRDRHADRHHRRAPGAGGLRARRARGPRRTRGEPALLEADAEPRPSLRAEMARSAGRAFICPRRTVVRGRARRGLSRRPPGCTRHWHRIVVVMPTTQATRARLCIGAPLLGSGAPGRCDAPGVPGMGARHRLRVAVPSYRAKRRDRNRPATPPCQRSLYRARRDAGGGPVRGGSSAGERPGRRDLRCTDDRRRPCTRETSGSIRPARRRVPQRAIEIVGIVLGIALMATVARSPWPLQRRVLVAGGRPVDGGPSLLHGVRSVQLHRVASPLGDGRMGVRDHPGGAVPRVRERGVQPLRHPARRTVPGDQRGLCAGARRPGRTGGRHRAAARRRHRRHRRERPGTRLLVGLAPARTADVDQGAARPTLAASSCRRCALSGSTPTGRSCSDSWSSGSSWGGR